MRRGIKRNFNAVRLSEAEAISAGDGPYIICANHPGWWDPAVFAFLQHTYFPETCGYGPIEAAALKRYPLLERAGLLPVDIKDRSSLRRFLRTAQRILEAGNILWITPQGHFSDVRQRPVVLQSGFAHLARLVPGVRMVPLAIEYSFWTESKPELFLRFGATLTLNPAETTQSMKTRMEQALTETMDRLACDVQSHEPERFRTLLEGKNGVGGFYDIGRRVRQWLRGARFEAGHKP
ncbi:hypothetical protein D5366_08605 [Neokomagataea tanensis]|uniref:Phospholipid/glycerol acyltransferase domain-containing protein n=2 Tax=Acetobacteraceae TaxID=433 RepID=A0A4Y6VBW7_9PROT|nr:hypothetical protein D5366_08605 [Neokomagataea tanensis]